MLRPAARFLAVAIVLLVSVSLGDAQTNPISYIYDELGRLKAAIDPAADTAIYTYDAVGNLLSIARQSSSTPAIIALTSSAAMVGATVTIEGTGFGATPGQNTVTFNGTAATVTSASATQLVVTVPVGATTGSIVVTAPGGNATSPGSFTVLTSTGAPTITSFTPSVGTPGTAVTISGTGFDTVATNDKVAFNLPRARGPVTSATVTALGVTVPAGATSGRITVSTPIGTTVSSGDFFVPPSPYVAADVVATGRLVTGGSTLSLTIGTVNKVGLVVFEGTAGQRLGIGRSAVTIASSDLTVYKPDGTVLATLLEQNAKPFHLPELPVTGTYTLLVDPRSNFTGNVTFTLSEDLTGTITVGGSAVVVSVPRVGQRTRLTFSGTSGERLDLGISDMTISQNLVTIVNPSGAIVTGPTSGSSPRWALHAPPLSVTGTHTILVEPRDSYTGNATLTLSDEFAASATTDGSPTAVTISRAGQRARIAFTGTADQRLNVVITGITITSSQVSVVKPDGTPLFGWTIWFWAGAGDAFDIGPLPSTGTYALILEPVNLATGNATVKLWPELDGTLTPGGGAVTATIPNAGQRIRYTFSGTANQRISVTTGSISISSATLRIYNPNGSLLVQQGFGTGSPTFVDTRTLSATGTYYLFVDPNQLATGSVTVTVYDVPADLTGTLTLNGSAVTLPLNTPGQKAAYTFSGTSGQGITIRGRNNTINCPPVRLIPPSGGTPSWAPCGASFDLTNTLQATGTHTIEINPWEAATGSLDLSVTNP